MKESKGEYDDLLIFLHALMILVQDLARTEGRALSNRRRVVTCSQLTIGEAYEKKEKKKKSGGVKEANFQGQSICHRKKVKGTQERDTDTLQRTGVKG